MNRKELVIKKIGDYFAKQPYIVAVYLYGSYARNEESKESDIDLASLFEDKVRDRLKLRLHYENQLGKLLGATFEIQELNICRVDFAYRVLQEGILVRCNNENARIAFENKILQNYFDLQPFFAEYYSVLQQQSLKGDFHA